jgi:hypothetical protein
MAAVPAGLATALQDRYRLDRELGQGGMATVCLAHDLRNNRPVALKVLRPELAAILGAERFLKEIETTANLQHPHILPLFDSGAAHPSHPERSEGSLSFLSPDGRQIGFLQGGLYDLKVMPATGGPPVTLVQVGSGAGGAWSSDGWIYFDSPSGFKRIPAVGGTAALVVPLDTANRETGLAWPDALPGGRGLLLRSRRNWNPEDFDLIAVEIKTGQRHILGKGVLARYLAPGYLLIVRADGALLAAAFDRERLRITGPIVPILEGIATTAAGFADLAVSAAGTLAYVAGGASGTWTIEAVWVWRDGSVHGLNPPLRVTPGINYGLALSPDATRLALDVATKN